MGVTAATNRTLGLARHVAELASAAPAKVRGVLIATGDLARFVNDRISLVTSLSPEEHTMQHITVQMLVDAINELDDPFDAHDVERRVLRNQPVAMANEILRYANSGDVLRTFSAQFSRHVDTVLRGQIQQTAKVSTANLGGLVSECQQWKKLLPPLNAGGTASVNATP